MTNNSVNNDELQPSLQSTLLPGAVEWVKIQLIPYTRAEGFDLRFVMQELNIYEDLYSSTMSGNLIIADALNLLAHYPIVGNEELEIEFRVPTFPESVKLKFDVYKVTNRSLVTNSQQTYQLHFTSSEEMWNHRINISRSWRDQPAETIIQEILTNYLHTKKKLDFEPTKHRQSVVIPLWDGFRTIQFLTSKAVSKQNSQGKTYFFYENRDGFNFRSLEQLYRMPFAKNIFTGRDLWYMVQPANVRPEPRSGVRDLDSDMRSIQGYEFRRSFDIIENFENGLYGNKVVCTDIFNHKFSQTVFDYKNAYGDQKHIEEEGATVPGVVVQPNQSFKILCPVTDMKRKWWTEQSANRLVPRSFKTYNRGADEEYEGFSEVSLGDRLSRLQSLNGYSLNIVVPGDTFRKVGERIHVWLPSTEPVYDGEAKVPDKYMSGAYLVTAIRHHITNQNYFMNIEAVKDSFGEPLPLPNLEVLLKTDPGVTGLTISESERQRMINAENGDPYMN